MSYNFSVLPEWVCKHRLYILCLLEFRTFHCEVGCPTVTSSGGKGKDGEDLWSKRKMGMRGFKKGMLAWLTHWAVVAAAYEAFSLSICIRRDFFFTVWTNFPTSLSLSSLQLSHPFSTQEIPYHPLRELRANMVTLSHAADKPNFQLQPAQLLKTAILSQFTCCQTSYLATTLFLSVWIMFVEKQCPAVWGIYWAFYKMKQNFLSCV